jgi:putative flippase GtrA
MPRGYPRPVRALYDRFRVLIHEAAKFGVVGLFNAALDIALFNWLHFSVGIGPLTSKAISVTVAATSSYFMNRHWAFAHRARTGIRREYVLFIVLSAVGLAIVEACLAFTRYGLGLTDAWSLNIAANGVGLVLGTLWRFWSFKRWVFLPNEDGTRQAAEAAISTTA